jgi:hypothetical protein
MAGPLLDIWGNYDQAYNQYNTLSDLYNKQVDTWNTWLDDRIGAQPVRPDEADMPAEPIAPMGDRPNTSLGNIDPTQLYQTVFGRSTPDALSNEAWSLANLTSPFFSNIDATPYETGAVNRANNPLYYMSPTELTTGQINQPEASSMYDQNQFY